MSSPPPTMLDSGLEDADHPDPRVPSPVSASNRLRTTVIILLLIAISLLAVVVFIAITIGVTIVVGYVLPRPATITAPIAGVAVAALCFGAASRIRKGALRNRYGLFRRPPRDLGTPPADR